MPGLMDVAPSFRKVTVKGVDVDIPGISSVGIAYLFTRFPIVRELIGGKDVELDPMALAKLAPDAVAALIATGCGYVDDKAAEEHAAKLGAEVQLDLLDAIVKETMPTGIAPFVVKLESMFKGLGVESMSIPAGASPKASKS